MIDFSFYKDRRVLIIGGIGFIGSNLALALVKSGADVLLVDGMNENYGANMHNISPIINKVKVNISDIRDHHVLPILLDGQEVIFNLAGQTSHLDSMKDPKTDLEINCVAQLSILEACRFHNPKATIVFASTRQVYGRPQYLPVDEDHPVQPVDVNGINKIAGEFYHNLYSRVYDLKAITLRLTNTYGPRMRIKDERQTFLGVWVRNALTGVPIEIWGGQQRRDYNYVDDVVESLMIAGQRPDLSGQLFNIGSSEVLSLRETADIINGILPDSTSIIREFPEDRKKIDIGDYHSSYKKFHDTTGWIPKTDFKTGISKTIEYYKSELNRYL